MTSPYSTSDYSIRPMTLDDYDDIMALVRQIPGVMLRDADSRESTERYLLRNPAMSFVAHQGDLLVGCAMSGHDGRRGYLQHVCVLPAFRERGIASALVEHCLAALEREGMLKTHIEVLATNPHGQAFWANRQWALRSDIHRYSFIRGGGDNV